MLFNSYIFLLLFLPLVIVGYFSLNHFKLYRLAMIFVLIMSLWFYGYFNAYYLLIMIASIVMNYVAYKYINKYKDRIVIKRTIAATAIVINVAALFYFKYYDFFIENINALFKTDFTLMHIVLPLGISFFTFQQLSFVIDSYKGDVPQYNIIDYACFVTYFPQLVAGPIVTHDELVPQFEDKSKKSFRWDNFSKGLFAFTLGLSKKVLIADMMGNAVNWGYANLYELDSINALIVTLCYTIQIYFDFSGYSDMAIGMGKMMNIDLPLNFNSPYKALTINDFWNRWHMTLTRFFKKYIYIPLGGNRKGVFRTYLNMMIVYLISGIWHGANWTFIFWGVCHGLFCIISRHNKIRLDKLHPVLNWIITFSFVNLMWIFFRADSIGDAVYIIQVIAGGNISGGIHPELVNSFLSAEWNIISYAISIVREYNHLILIGYIILSLIATLGMKNVYERVQTLKPKFSTTMMISVLLTLCIMSFSGVSTFLYFNF
ncbi:MAG: MBOAT family protein [Ruminococcus sp.]|nr:MBOAT family protein [Ruminococcus sp.]